MIMLFVCLALFCVFACCKSNRTWVNRNRVPEFFTQGRERIRAYRYQRSLERRDESWYDPAA